MYKAGCALLEHLPDQSVIDHRVAVDQDIAEGDYPRKVRYPGRQVRVYF
jgi:hypothetical protein